MVKPTRKPKAKASKMPASICWLDGPTDDLGRAKKFRQGYFAICEDTEHNAFALWRMNQHAR